MTNLNYKRDDYERQKAITEQVQDYIEDFEHYTYDKDLKDRVTDFRFSIHKSLYERVKNFCKKRRMTMSELFRVSMKDYGLSSKYPEHLELIPKEKSQQLKIFVTLEEYYYIELQIKTSGLTKNEYIAESIRLRLKNSKGYTKDSLFEICKQQIEDIEVNDE